MKEFAEAKTYCNFMAKLIKGTLRKNGEITILRKNVLYAIVIMCLLGISKKHGEDIEPTLELCKDYLSKSKSIQITLCLKLMINKIENEATNSEEELLVTEEFERLVFVTLFVPFIKQTVPTKGELRIARKRFLPDTIRPSRLRTPVSFRSYQPPKAGRLGSPGRSYRAPTAGRVFKRRKEKLMRNSLDYYYK